MRRRWFQFDWSIALVASIALHVALVQWMLHDQILALAKLLWDGRPAEPTVIALTDRPDVRDPGQLGDAHGVGTSIADSPGDVAAASPHDADDQPFLSRDPAGLGKVGDKPSPYTGPTGGAMSAAMDGNSEQLSPDAAFPQPQQPTPRVLEQPPRAAQPPPTNAVNTTGDGAPAAQAETAQTAPPTAAGGGKNGAADQKPTPTENPDVIARVDPTKPAVRPVKPPGAPASAVGVPHEAQTSSPPIAAAAGTAPPSASAAKPSAAATDSHASGAPQATSTPPPAPATPRITPPHPQVAMASPAAPSASAKAPGRPMRSADPAPQADSEIDPFSKNPSVVFRGGKMTVQAGRKSKLTRPAISLSGFWDGIALGHVEVTLHIVLDSTGAVVRADVLKSSGSNEIDNPISVEAYNWWFEPDKDENGKPIATDFPFVVGVFR